MMTPRSASGWVKLMAIVLIVAAVSLFQGMKRLAAEWETQAWPVTVGTVISTEVVELPSPLSQRRHYGPNNPGLDRSPRYRTIVRYRYQVGDHEYIGTRLSLHQRDHRDRDGATHSLAAYYPGQTVEVRYSSDSPNNALLKAGVRPWTVFVVLFGVSMTLFAGFMIRSVLKNNGNAGWNRPSSK